MVNKNFVMGLDIGTTSAKAVIFTKSGQVIADSEIGYSFLPSLEDHAEQDPLIIEQAAIKVINHSLKTGNISGDQLTSVGLSSAMHSLICSDKTNQPLSPSITWADRRSALQAEKLKSGGETRDIYSRSGTPIHSMSPFVKLVWMKETDYDPYLKASKFLSIKEFLTSRWFGEDAVDFSVASATGLFDIHTLDWNDHALLTAGIKRSQLSRPVLPTYIFQGLDPETASKMGVPEDLPFVAGGSDGPMANLGIGAINPGDTALTIGTSGAIRQMASCPKTDENQNIFCYGVSEDLWILGGPTNNGAIILQWMKEVFGDEELAKADEKNEDPFSLLCKKAAQSPPGAKGLLFMPYLNGERAPYWDPNVRGSYIGLTMKHKKEDLLRAGMEGVIFNLYTIYNVVEQLVGKTTNLYASGGFARSPLWVQILADIFEKEVHLPVSHQSSAWGAAWFSMLATGEVNDLESIKEFVPMQEIVRPNSSVTSRYQELYAVYRKLYGQLKPVFDDLKKLEG
ncbi:gluconokinase [Salipaludibacillus aurantiacus]|uniref:Gluconokinase n=1 Tax=Salipaludibacillus aurantiacus TaxID=1601833 RepID=A0A1H9UAM5_9BACI|nr:gluconokinase [Salipaludibacillus aurantiacus]SES06600.1 gluconokinase [Salipaludibacillus aurantiacus]